MEDILELREFARHHHKPEVRVAARNMADQISGLARGFSAHVTSEYLIELNGRWAYATAFMAMNPVVPPPSNGGTPNTSQEPERLAA